MVGCKPPLVTKDLFISERGWFEIAGCVGRAASVCVNSAGIKPSRVAVTKCWILTKA